MGIKVKITAGTTDGRTIEQFQKTIENRIKYLNQSARQSVMATCIDILKSIRPQTKVAKASSIKVEVTRENNLYPSFSKKTGKPTFCLRVTGTKNRYIPNNEVVVRLVKKITKSTKVFRFTNKSENLKIKKRNYLIVSDTISEAKKHAKKIATSFIKRYAGLAKLAITLLMKKTAISLNTGGEVTNETIRKIANNVTSLNEQVKESDKGGSYTITLSDDLRYAIKAIKGEQNSINIAFKKAINKVAGNISHKLKNSDFWGNSKIQTPFPELKQK